MKTLNKRIKSYAIAHWDASLRSGSRPFPSGPVLVTGSGAIEFGTIWSLRAAGYAGELVAQIKPGKGTQFWHFSRNTNRIPPQDNIDRIRPVMDKIQNAVEFYCRIDNFPDLVVEECRGVVCK